MIEYRTIDGSGNNLSQPQLNTPGTDFARIGPAHFADGVYAMVDGPNARTISNVLVAGNGDLPNPEGLSGMMYAWGQFIDHDLDLANADQTTHIDIPIPPGDPNLTASRIPLTRVVIDPATGHDGKPASAVNAITGWLDASMVYGSDQATADSLRLADGHMKTSADDYLPIVNGRYAAGDVRAQENPDLTALQTLFVREHNYQVDRLHKAHPGWSGEQLYQQARAIVTAEIAHITYSEFLPHLVGPNAIAPYHGYDPTVNPTITEEFAGAAYRFGHSIVSAAIGKLGEQGQALGPGQSLKDTFFQAPADFAANGGADGLLRHLAGDLSNALDVHIVDDLRNFLNDPPAAMDLAAINIQRAHDLGLGSLNQTRQALGLAPYTSFEQITSDPQTAAALKTAYGDVDKIDLWSGGLAEDHVKGAMVGQTFQKIIAGQFEKLRDGDRLWFENQGFDPLTLFGIEHTTLADIIQRDTNTGHMQNDAFVYYDRRTGTAGGIPAEHPEAPQLVIGSDGPDTLVGGPQNDMLVAGVGKQTLTGGGGADQFVVTSGSAVTITDFQPGQDKLVYDYAGKLDFHDFQISSEAGNTEIKFSGADMVLVGIDPHQLTLRDFMFGPHVNVAQNVALLNQFASMGSQGAANAFGSLATSAMPNTPLQEAFLAQPTRA